jgi:hypothetical protein
LLRTERRIPQCGTRVDFHGSNEGAVATCEQRRSTWAMLTAR